MNEEPQRPQYEETNDPDLVPTPKNDEAAQERPIFQIDHSRTDSGSVIGDGDNPPDGEIVYSGAVGTPIGRLAVGVRPRAKAEEK